MPLFGTETEYGIAVEGRGAADLVAESRALVRAYRGAVASPWYYRGEDPRNDMRGFHVDRLAQDPEDAKFDTEHKPMPMEEERADRVLTNGARLYNDHGHPEYSTPECASLFDLVTHDKAGERIVLDCARARMEAGGVGRVDIFKNNTDFHGSSYGTHENYLVARATPFADLLGGLLPFFATRIIYAGAGKVGSESRGASGHYQLSQRADFFTEDASVDTLYRRPLVNTRDEPHADARVWRRLHVICGDANMSEFATALKIGTTYLVTSLLDQGWKPDVALRSAVQSSKSISHDETYRWLAELSGGGTMPAVDIQRVYLQAAAERFAGRGTDTDWVLRAWEETLDGLERNPLGLADRLDWVAKRSLLSDYIESAGTSWKDESLASFDLAYSNIDPDEGLYYALEQAGEMVRVTDEASIVSALTTAPQNTRAAIRGRLVEKFAGNIAVIGWSRAILRTDEESWLVDLEDYITPDDVRPVLAGLNSATDLRQFIDHYRSGDK